MAKSKTNEVPTIRQNSSLMTWLNQETQSTTSPGSVETDSAAAPPAEVGTVTSSKGASEPLETSLVSDLQPALEEPDEAPKANALDDETSSRPGAVATSRKGKSKAESSASGQTYPELFFKKPVKSGQGEVAAESKPIRISEDSHWLLSVLVESARRLGNKLTVGDLIENLLAEHRKVHKVDVDAYIDQWKTRKRIS